MNPQTAIQQTSKEAARIARSLVAISECLAAARPDSTVVRASQTSIARLGVDLSNAAVYLQRGILGGERDE